MNGRSPTKSRDGPGTNPRPHEQLGSGHSTNCFQQLPRWKGTEVDGGPKLAAERRHSSEWLGSRTGEMEIGQVVHPLAEGLYVCELGHERGKCSLEAYLPLVLATEEWRPWVFCR